MYEFQFSFYVYKGIKKQNDLIFNKSEIICKVEVANLFGWPLEKKVY